MYGLCAPCVKKQIIKYKSIILEVTVNLALFLVSTNQILTAKLT